MSKASVITLAIAVLVWFLPGCGLFGREEVPAVYGPPPVVGGGGGALGGMPAVAATREASEARRLRDEHARLRESIPTVTPEPTETVEEVSRRELVRVLDNPGGIPVGPGVDEMWFDPERGLFFYRSRGGDWTPRLVRDNHTHRLLFYHEGYPGGC